MKDVFTSLIKLISEGQKSLLITFCVSLPVVYTILYLFVDGYRDFDLVERVVFAGAASIALITIVILTFSIITPIINIATSYYAILLLVLILLWCLIKQPTTGEAIMTHVGSVLGFFLVIAIGYRAIHSIRSNKKKK